MGSQTKQATICADKRIQIAVKREEDVIDLAALRDRAHEPLRPFEDFLEDLKSTTSSAAGRP